MSDSTRDIRAVGIIGAGTMGSGIAQVIAQAGIPVTLVDRRNEDLDRGMASIQASLGRLLKKHTITQQSLDETLGRLSLSISVGALADVDLAIEAIYEDLEAKFEVLHSLDSVVDSETIVASNTSSLSISALAGTISKPERFVGLHFFNPAPVLPLVEVVKGRQTSEETLARATEFTVKIGKSPVLVKDVPGFAVNRILLPMINEAICALDDGVAGREAIDMAMTLGARQPMGPLALADLIGLDICLSIMEVLHRELGNDKYEPSPLLRRMVTAGKLGRKSGEGFYVY